MPKVFICYRREDSAYPAHQIYGSLTNHFGSESVVFDVDSIPLGIDFRKYLNEQVGKCDIMLVVIGDKWMETLKQGIDEPNDFVRIEIKAALEKEIPVVPILIGNASVPIEKDLPEDIAGLAYLQGTEVRAGPDLKIHLNRLIDGLENLIVQLRAEEEAEGKPKGEERHKQEEEKKSAEEHRRLVGKKQEQAETKRKQTEKQAVQSGRKPKIRWTVVVSILCISALAIILYKVIPHLTNGSTVPTDKEPGVYLNENTHAGAKLDESMVTSVPFTEEGGLKPDHPLNYSEIQDLCLVDDVSKGQILTWDNIGECPK